MVLCCLFWCQSFGDVSPYICYLFLVRFRLLSLGKVVILTICNFSYFPFWFEGGI